jgi:signal transduction histidine kinase
MLERVIELGEEGRFLVSVAGDAAEIDDETKSFDRALLITFGVLAVVLLLTTTFQVQFGLAPLNRISEGLAAIRSGAAERLEGRFPVEIAPLARETNALIDANREIVTRARTHVGNLAHALKTPISVMMNEATTHAEDPLALKVREQTEIMRDQVARYLERRGLPRVVVIGTVTEAGPVITALARTMEKIHHDRGIAIAIDAPEAALGRRAAGLEEMIGNLVDNACAGAAAGGGGGVSKSRRHRRAPVAHRGRRRCPASRSSASRWRAAAVASTSKPGSGPAFDRDRARQPLRGISRRHRPDRRPACRTGAAGGVRLTTVRW